VKIAILSGSVFGTAERVARHAQERLAAAGFNLCYAANTSLPAILEFAPDALLVVTSTTGHGELPNNLLPLAMEIRDTFPAWRGLPGGIIALGDSNYRKTFCQGGEQIRELFAELGVREVQEMLRLDASETIHQDTDAEPWLDAFAQSLR